MRERPPGTLDTWLPCRNPNIVEALVTYLPALAIFLIAPLWMLQTRSTENKTAAVVGPTRFVLGCSQILRVIGLQHTGEAYTAATWVSSRLEVLAFSLPAALAVILYRQFPATPEHYAEIDLATYPSGDHTAKRMMFSATSQQGPTIQYQHAIHLELGNRCAGDSD